MDATRKALAIAILEYVVESMTVDDIYEFFDYGESDDFDTPEDMYAFIEEMRQFKIILKSGR
jgi:hypothetical protein